MNKILAFLDVRIDNKIPSGLITSVYRKATFTGLLTNFFSFTAFSYKLGLIRTLLDRTYKISNTLSGFNEEVRRLSHIFQKNQFPEGMINKAVKTYLDSVSNSENFAADSTTSSNDICILYFKLPYLVLSSFVQSKERSLVKRYCKDLKIKLAFSTFKIKNLMKVKDSVPRSLHSNVIYTFTCAECNSAYVGETSRHLSTRVREHLVTDKNSHIFKHLKGSDKCRSAYNDSVFSILDSVSTHFQLKFKEALQPRVRTQEGKGTQSVCVRTRVRGVGGILACLVRTY